MRKYPAGLPKHIICKAKDYIIEDMVTAARDNRLFMSDSFNALRQIGLKSINGEINITVSDPIKDAPPKSPSTWTYIKSWFNNEEAKAEIQAYKEAKAFQKSFHRLVEDRRYSIDPNPKPRKLAAQKVEKQQPKVKTEPLNPSQMSPEQFYNHLEAMVKQGEEIKPSDVCKSASIKEFYKSLTQIMEGQIAGNIKRKVDKIVDPTKKNAFLDDQKRLYTSLVAGLSTFIAGEMEEEFIEKDIANKSTGLLMVTVMRINEHGVEEYMKSIQEQNEVNKQMEQSQPQQVQQPSVQAQQMQQPEASKPMGMGGGPG